MTKLYIILPNVLFTCTGYLSRFFHFLQLVKSLEY